MDGGALTALVVSGLAKAVGSRIATNADLGFLGDLLKAATETGGKAAEGPVQDWVNSWLRPHRRKRLLERATWYDLAGLAWGELLYGAEDGTLLLAFQVDAGKVRDKLDAEWFVGLMDGPRGREVPLPSSDLAYGEALESSFVQGLADLLSGEILEVLETDPDRTFLLAMIEGLPAGIARLAQLVPGYDARVARLTLVESVVPALQRLLDYADGTAASQEALGHMDRLSQEALALAERDTFGREPPYVDLPKLVHREVYVEPSAGAGLAKQQIRQAWEQAPFVVLRAPFGMGKSLTCRDLTIDLAREWREDPARPFPLRIDCPDLLLGGVATLREAVIRHLEAEEFSEDAAKWLWGKAKLTVLLDGFDEVAQPEAQLKRWIEDMALVVRRQGLRILLCTRPYGYDSAWLKGETAELDLQPLDDLQVREWLARHAKTLGSTTPTLEEIEGTLDNELSRTPILLLMALFSWGQPSHEGIEGKAGLYARFVDRISTGKWSELQAPHPAIDAVQRALGAELFQEALARVAWAHLVHTGGRDDASLGLPVRELESRLQAWHPLSEGQLAEVSRALVLSLFFRQGELKGELRFSHRSFREFLCARYLLLQAEREPNALLLALAEAETGRETLCFLEEILRPRPELLRSALSTVESAFDRAEDVVFAGKWFRMETWGGRTVGLVSKRRSLSSFLARCDDASTALRRQASRPDVWPLNKDWVYSWDFDRAWHRASGRTAFCWPGAHGEPRELSPHDFDGWEAVGGLMLYWLDGMREPQTTHRQLAALWGSVASHLARGLNAPPPTWLELMTSPDGRWLLGGHGYTPHNTWLSAWARSARTVFEMHPGTSDVRSLRVALALAADQSPEVRPPWSELLGLWAAFVERCD